MPQKESPFPPKTDFYSKHGAGLLAEHINEVWAKRGHPQVFAERYQIAGTQNWGVDSNLLNGLPPAKVRKAGSGKHTNGKRVLTPRIAA